ncbi:Las1-like-domain-containing protein [Sporodiniella umbellata]|nr:Las1-like-domain-containing protein [Sporodiniella umbellata]
MSNIRIVPWTNQAEFECIYRWLFSDRKKETKTVQLALDRIQTWSNRGQLPSSIEITGLLIESIIRDEQHGHTMSHKELRLLYSMGIIRFVNGLVDQEQNKKHAQTVLTIAKSINLPSWYVDLRHESTHERLPSLSVLRSAATQAVAWLHDHYWVQNINIQANSNKEDLAQSIKAHMNAYKESRKNYLKNIERDPTVYVDCIEALIMAINNKTIKEEVIPLLLGVGGLVPSSKKKRATLEKMKISNDLVQTWTPLLEGLSGVYSSFVPELISSMIQKLCSIDEYVLDERITNPFAPLIIKEEDPTQNVTYMLTLTCWMQFFVSELSEPASERTLANLYVDDILEKCLKNPNFYTQSILKTICRIDSEIAESIKPFMQYIEKLLKKTDLNKREGASLEATSDEAMEDELKKMQAQFQQIETVQRDTKRQKRYTPNKKGWKLYESWKPCPIGMLPNGVLPSLDMREYMQK